MKFIKTFWLMIGNNNKQRFWRLIIILWTIGLIIMLIVNVGYEKSKGGWYWKPADISIKRGE